MIAQKITIKIIKQKVKIQQNVQLLNKMLNSNADYKIHTIQFIANYIRTTTLKIQI